MRHYLDHAATSPLRPAALEAMTEAWRQIGNPSSQHASGRAAHAALEDARERLAAALGADPSEVVFTGGGTEADNLVVLGGAGDPATSG
ncbi:MAG: aminotransferase class V-fold PLP-dependent enzyme, partial [Propioniciclava sp.]